MYRNWKIRAFLRPGGRHISLLFMCFFTAPASAEGFIETLRGIVDSHPQIEAAQASSVAGRADVSAARAAERPQLSLTVDTGWSRRGLTSLSDSAFLPSVKISQLLYDGDRTGSEIERRKSRARALEVEEERVFSELSNRLADTWVEWSRRATLLRISNEQVAALEQLHARVREIASFDQGRQSDVALVGTRLSLSMAAADGHRVALWDLRAQLRQIAASPIEPEGPLPDATPFLPRSLDAAFALVDNAPDLRIASHRFSEANASVDAARGWWKPQFALEAASESESNLRGETRMFGTVAVRLRTALTPFDGGGGTARLASAKASASAVRLEMDYRQRLLHDEVERQWILIRERSSRMTALEALVGNTDQSRDIVYEQFRLGRRSVLDLLSFEMERFNARAQLANEQFDLLSVRFC